MNLLHAILIQMSHNSLYVCRDLFSLTIPLKVSHIFRYVDSEGTARDMVSRPNHMNQVDPGLPRVVSAQ